MASTTLPAMVTATAYENGLKTKADLIDGKVKDAQLPEAYTVNVRDYGAVGDKTTDDTAAINRAYAALSGPTVYGVEVSRRLHFPAGIYTFNGNLPIEVRAMITGDGPEATTIFRGSNAFGDLFTLQRSHSQIRDLTIDQSSATATGDHIVLNSAYARVHNLYLSKPGGNAITVGKAGAAIAYKITDSLIRDPKGYGIRVIAGSGSTDGIATNVDVGRAGLAGIRIDNGGQNLSLVHSWESGTLQSATLGDRSAFWLNSSSNVLVGCQGEKTMGAGVAVTGSGSDGNQIHGGKYWANVASGIYNLEAPGMQVTGVQLYNNGVGNTEGTASTAFAAILLDSTNSCVIEGNRIRDTGAAISAGTSSPYPGRTAVRTQPYSIAEIGTSDFNTIVGNHIRKEDTRSGQPVSILSNSSRYEANNLGDLAVPQVASAATIRVPAHVEMVDVTGQATITSIIRRQAGRVVRLRFTDAAPGRVANGTTVRLAGDADYQPASGDVLTLTSTGLAGQWNESGRTSITATASVAATVTPPDLTYALAKFRAGLRRRDTAPVLLFPAGSSTTFGQAASTTAKSYVGLLNAALQSAYPKADGSANAAMETGDASSSVQQPAGVKTINYGKASTTSADFITSAQLDKMVTQSSTTGVAHLSWMVGSNDWSRDIRVATFKSNMQAWITLAKSKFTAAGKPFMITLIATYGRVDSSAQVAPKEAWPLFVQAMRELATADRENVAFVDLSETYRAAGIPATGAAYDPFDLLTTDDVHQNDYGHEFMAAELIRQMNIPVAAATVPTGGTTPTTPTTPTFSTITSDDFTGAATTTLAGRTTDAAKGGVGVAWSTPTGSSYAIDGSGFLVPGPTRAAVETAGFSVGKPSMSYEMEITNLAGGSFWLDVRAESTSTTTVGTYRAILTTSNAVQLNRRTSGGGAGTGNIGTGGAIPNGGTWAGTHVVRVEVSDLADGSVYLRALVDGVQVTEFTDTTTTKLTTGNFVRHTSTQSVTSYKIGYVTARALA